jgi:hypothetical protein
VTLPAFLSETHKVGDQGLRFDTRGVVERWLNKDEWLNWDFKVNHPGTFEVVLLSSEQNTDEIGKAVTLSKSRWPGKS